jgi:hypothetical protein
MLSGPGLRTTSSSRGSVQCANEAEGDDLRPQQQWHPLQSVGETKFPLRGGKTQVVAALG